MGRGLQSHVHDGIFLSETRNATEPFLPLSLQNILRTFLPFHGFFGMSSGGESQKGPSKPRPNFTGDGEARSHC